MQIFWHKVLLSNQRNQPLAGYIEVANLYDFYAILMEIWIDKII